MSEHRIHRGLARQTFRLISGLGLLLSLSQVSVAQTSGADRAAPAPAPAKQGEGAATPRSGNVIQITGNTVSGVRCADGGTASINSVNINGASLKGRTVIIQGNNENSVKDVDCEQAPADGQAAPRWAPVQVNSINIR